MTQAMWMALGVIVLTLIFIAIVCFALDRYDAMSDKKDVDTPDDAW